MVERNWIKWGIILGFALGGFFDGILLHQILQWHHLLSLVPGVDTLRGQVLWDGYFHALMYVIAVIGIWRLWAVRGQAGGGSHRGLFGALLIGFGVWHIIDGILSHWLLGIHRIKLDSADPLLWDLIWLVAFGAAPALLGWLVLRKPSPNDGRGGATLSVLVAGALTTGAAAWSLQPSADQPFATVVFAPWVSPAEAVNAVMANGGRLMWTDRRMAVMVVDVPEKNRLDFYGQGALLVSGSGLPNGCFNWSRI